MRFVVISVMVLALLGGVRASMLVELVSLIKKNNKAINLVI